MQLPALSLLAPRLTSAPELQVRVLGDAAFDAAEALQLFSLLEGSACEITTAQAFELIGAHPQDPDEAFRLAMAVELLGLSAH